MIKSIFEAYQTLFPFRQSIKSLSSTEELKSIIRTELLDELTHPRVRLNPSQKYQQAVLRMEESNLTEQEIVSLRAVYNEVFNSVNTF